MPNTRNGFATLETELKRMRREYESLKKLKREQPKTPSGLFTLSVVDTKGCTLHSYPDQSPKEFIELRRNLYRILNMKMRLGVKFKRTAQLSA